METQGSAGPGEGRQKQELKPYKLKELADLYRVCTRTMRKWLKPIARKLGKRTGHYYQVWQVRIIFTHLDPDGTGDDDPQPPKDEHSK